ncbi:MAG: asparagine synthetase B [Cyclobacteriaceae bacterium]|nr:asparagine synthetase B [Cyclobacteriaceae bacterium]
MKCVWLIAFVFLAQSSVANSIFIPMDESQRDHLKAYGVAYYTLKEGQPVDWLLNYRGGSFLIPFHNRVLSECKVRGISFELISEAKTNSILTEIARPDVNLNVVRLETAPRVAVYSPKNELIEDDTDAVMLVLDYAEIPYTIIYDEEILKDELTKFDWLHLHHEDFTGQHGRFMRRESAIIQAKIQEETALRLGYASVTDMKLAVAKRIKGFTAGGGYLFAMCSGAETFDIALAAEGSGISFKDFSGDEDAALDYSKTLAFENFSLEPAASRKFSDINALGPDFFQSTASYFQLFQFSAKWDIVPSLLTQNHEQVIKEFSGQTSSFNAALIKPSTWVLGENRGAGRARYLYGELGRGHWTYYSGHDPEGMPGWRRANTDLSMHPHSPGYRLILNNVLFPSAKKKKQKT